MRVKLKSSVVIANDAALKDKLFALDESNDNVMDGFTEQSSGRAKLNPTSTSLTVPFGGVSAARGCYIRVTKACTITLNGTAMVVIPGAGSATNVAIVSAYARFLFEGTISTLAVSYSGTEECEVVYTVWGDAIA